MTSDYDAIRSENLREYGEGDRHLAFLANLYSDRTHFILELLQNAEDAQATHVKFEIFENRLEFRHTGRLFTPDDVRGICGVDQSTKSTDLTTIGKFGVGFKSVYAYTTAPSIYSGSENFTIRHFVRPESAKVRLDVGARETLQVFPLDRPDTNPATAFNEITEALDKLNSATLLFLKNITKITITQSFSQRILDRKIIDSTPHTVRTSSRVDGEVESSTWWLFTKDHSFDGSTGMPVQIAFLLDQDETSHIFRPKRIDFSPLSVFFPTEKETHLGFILQGPFRTTPARDNVPATDPWNQSLVTCASELVVDALRALRELKLLTMDVLQTLPIHTAQFRLGGMFDPMHRRIIEAFQREDLIPTNAGGYTRAGFANLPRTAAVRELFTDDDLTDLLGNGQNLRWLPASNTIDSNLSKFIQEVLQIREIEFSKLLENAPAKFFENKSDEWMIEFYSTLQLSPALFKRVPSRQRVGIARSRPIIRLRSGEHVNPFNSAGEPNAFLPADTYSSEFPTVNDSLSRNENSRAFLLDLGIDQPDALAEIERFILPTYDDPSITAEDAKITTDWRLIQQALQGGPVTPMRRKQIMDKLKLAPILKCLDSNGSYSMVSPTQAYTRTLELERYFSSDLTKSFVGEIYREYNSLLRELGVSTSVRVTARPANSSGHVSIRNTHGDHIRGLSGFDPGLSIEGIEFALQAPTAERSAFIWNSLLVPRSAVLVGEVEVSSRQDFSRSEKRRTIPAITELLRSTAWLPHSEHGFVTPDQLSLIDLPEIFHRDDVLAIALAMQTSAIGEASAELGISMDDLRLFRDNPELVESFAKFVRNKREQKNHPEVSDTSHDTVPTAPNFADAIRSTLDRNSGSPAIDTDSGDLELDGHGLVRNPSLRRERVLESISTASKEVPLPTQRLNLQTASRPHDESVRAFLRDQYSGHCQVCRSTFQRQDGSPYFETFALADRKLLPHSDRPGGVLSLCPTCYKKFQYGTVQLDNLDPQIRTWHARAEGGDTDPRIEFLLCGEFVVLRFTEKHFLDLQELFRYEELR